MTRYTFILGLLFFFCTRLHAQNVLSLTSDTVRISGSTDSGELVLRNHTRNIPGVLYNKGNGITEFRLLRFIRVGDSTLLILGTDTVTVGPGTGAAGSVYYGDPDINLSATVTDTSHMRLNWWKTDNDLYQSARIGIIGDSQGWGGFASAYQFSIFGRLQNFIYATANNDAITNYCVSGYNSRKLMPTGSNLYVDNNANITRALTDGNKIIILCNTSNDFYSGAAGGVTGVAESMSNTLAIADACQKAGATLFVVSSFPRTSLDPTMRDSLNSMAGLLNQKFGSRCAYVFHLLENPANPNTLLPSLSRDDSIHLNDAGCGIVYSAVRDMLTSYYTSNATVAKYQLQRAKNFNSSFSDYQYITTVNTPSLTVPADSGFYRVRLVYNNGYYSKWSNTIQGTLAHQDVIVNQPPMVASGTPKILLVPASSTTLSVNASDPNTGGTITAYHWFVAQGNAATFGTPDAATTAVSGLVEGTYIFRCQVTNNLGLQAFADQLVTVELPDSNNTAAKFDLNLSPHNISGWLDVSASPLAATSNGASWTDNIHNITLVNLSNSTAVWGPDFHGNAGDNNGSPVADAGGYPIPKQVIGSGWYSHYTVYSGPSSNQMKFTGLSPAKRYKLKFYSSIDASFGFDANPTVFVVNDNTIDQKQVNAVGNTSNVVIFRGIVPNTSGEIPFFVGIPSGQAEYGMLNGATIQEDSLTGSPVPPAVTVGANVTIQLPVNNTSLTATVTDIDGSPVSVAWTQVSGPAGAIFSDPAALHTSFSNLAQGTYVLRCTVTDNYGASGHADVQVVVTPPSNDPMLYAGVTLTPYTTPIPGWTCIAGAPSQAVVSTTANLGSTPISISTLNTANWTPFYGSYSASNTGETNDDGGGMLAPVTVQQGNWFNENAYDVSKPQLQLSGLPAGTYTVTLFGSLQASFTAANGVGANTEFRVNGGSPVTINTSGNTSHAAVFQSITVDSSGIMNLYFNPTVPNTDFAVGTLCFFILDKTN
jgi:hypothetical protein